MKRIDLSRKNWMLRGWRPFTWQLRLSADIGAEFESDIPPIPAKVPGSALTALLAAGWVEDWNVGMNSLQCEWVEHRHWEFYTSIEEGEVDQGETVMLRADGLDYAGWILVDGCIVVTFKGALLRHWIDLTPYLSDGRKHVLSILFDQTPQEQGQAGFTSKSRHFKPRYNYNWDWCPRVVPTGIWDDLVLEIGTAPVELTGIQSSLGDDLRTGVISAAITCGEDGPAKVTMTISRDGRVVADKTGALTAGDHLLAVEIAEVELWWPNGEGDQPLYDVELTAGPEVIARVRVGFKRVEWLPCEDAPEGALPWICEVNGRPMFLRGVNWTPIRLDYHAIGESDYRRRVGLYREMGCNLLRIWGGAYLEREVFYSLCDEAGLLVWQEFPLSSSGPDNWPPEDPEVIDDLCRIARDYIRRRRHHACKLLWCGGNELQHAEGEKTGAGVPITLDHPCIAALHQVVQEEDPGARFLPTSSSGPRFFANEEDFGRGLHHDVHGPWNLRGDLDDWKAYWAADDSLFRSETGMPGASPVEIIERYCGRCNPWPPTRKNTYWVHSATVWIEWERYGKELGGLDGKEGLAKYVELSQTMQAEALGIAVRACRARFPRCGGMLIWMGHDAYPCAANTALIDFDGNPKPAWFAVRDGFRNPVKSNGRQSGSAAARLAGVTS